MRLILLVLALLSASLLFAREIPPLTGALIDETKSLSTGIFNEINIGLQRYHDESGKQLQVVLIDSLEGDVLEDFTIRAADKYHLGKKGEDQGVILFIIMKERKIRLEVGKGLEGKLTDLQCGRIITLMGPILKSGLVDKGVSVGIFSIIKTLGDNPSDYFSKGVVVKRRHPTHGLIYLIGLLFAVFIIGIGNRSRGFYSGGGGFGGGFGGSSGGSSSSWGGGGGGFSGGGASGDW